MPENVAKPVIEQEQPDPGHHRLVMPHRPVDPVAFPVHLRPLRPGYLGEADAKLVEQLLVVGVAGDRPELVDGAVDQPVHGAVRRELVEGDVEAGAIRRVPANMLRETDAPPKPGKIILDAVVVAGEPALREPHQIGQEQPHEHVEYVEVAELRDTGFIELCGAEAPPSPQHLEKHLPGAGELLGVANEIHLRQDLEHRAVPGLDDAHVVTGTELPVPERQHRAVIPLPIGLVGEREFLEVRGFIRGETFEPLMLPEDGQRSVLRILGLPAGVDPLVAIGFLPFFVALWKQFEHGSGQGGDPDPESGHRSRACL